MLSLASFIASECLYILYVFVPIIGDTVCDMQGFHVMGIWPACSNGSEVNSVDVCMEKGLVVTANDSAGQTRLFNYPCVVKVGEACNYYFCYYYHHHTTPQLRSLLMQLSLDTA